MREVVDGELDDNRTTPVEALASLLLVVVEFVTLAILNSCGPILNAEHIPFVFALCM